MGAVAYGFFSKTVTKQCREPTVEGECVSGQFANIQTERPDLIAGLAAAGALTVIGAVDALLGARKVNRERLRAAGAGDSGGMSVDLLPTSELRQSRQGDLRLLELRFR